MNPAIRNEVLCSHVSGDETMRDFCDGTYYKEHPVFSAHPEALQILLYYDDIEVGNPLGTKAGEHKLGK